MSKFLIPIILYMFFVGCSKDHDNLEPTDSSESLILKIEESSHRYYLDSKEVSEKDLNSKSLIQRKIIVEGDFNDPNSQTTSHHHFSSETELMKFSDKHNLKMGELKLFLEAAKTVATNYNAENFYKENGFLPKKYQNKVDELYVDHFGEPKNQKVLNMLKSNCDNGGATFPSAPGGLPVMWPGWNNRVSAHYVIGLGAIFHIFDRWLFRDYLITYVTYGLWPHCYPPGVDNKMSSLLTIGL